MILCESYRDNTVSLLIGFDFHFRILEGIVEAFPVGPNDALGIGRALSPYHVSSIQVTAETGVKPPGTCISLGTVIDVLVLVSVPG